MYLFIALNAGVGNSYNAVSVSDPPEPHRCHQTNKKESLGTLHVSKGICFVAYETFFICIDIFTVIFGI